MATDLTVAGGVHYNDGRHPEKKEVNLGMAAWRKVLVLGLAVVVGAVPVFARVDLGLQAAAPVVQQTSVPLPQGDELGDKELIQSEGEVGPLVWVVGIIWGALTGWATYEMTKAWGPVGAAVAGAIAAGGGLAIGAASSGPSKLQP